ncbi:hypothetical protein FRC17_001935 [Serendipita sp. 399]|nr:hypothetical protein FRC17_001935 [Serendipita sp. 399]
MSTTAPSPFKRFSAWTRGPPRSLSNSLGSVATGVGSPGPVSPASASTTKPAPLQTLQSTEGLDHNAEDVNFSPAEPSNPLTPSDTSGPESPPPRPRRNPARRSSTAGTVNDLSPALDTRMNSNDSDALPSTPQSSSHPSTPNWSSLLSQSKPAPPVSTEKPPVLAESRSRSRTRESSPVGDKLESGDGSFALPSLPPMPAYPPPLPPAPPTLMKSKLQADAMPFVPVQRKSTTPIVIKNAQGQAMDLQKLKIAVTGKVEDSGSTSPPTFVAAQSTAIRIESEDARRRRLEAEGSKLLGNSAVDSVEEVQDGLLRDTETSGHMDALASSISSLTILDEGSSGGPKSSDPEESWQQLEVPVLETSPPTAPLDGSFPGTAPPAPPIRMKRERSRRSSRRGNSSNSDSAGADPVNVVIATTSTTSGPPIAAAMIAMARTKSGNLTRTRSSEPKRRPVPSRLDLSGIPKPTATANYEIASAMLHARMITDIQAMAYPEADGIVPPLKELNEGITDGKFRYDRHFLLQFCGYCTERPHGMAELEEIRLEPVEPVEQPPPPTRTRSRGGRRRNSSNNQQAQSIQTAPRPGTEATNISATTSMAAPASDTTLPVTPLSSTLPVLHPMSSSMSRTGSRGGRSRHGSNAAKLSINTAATPSASGSTLHVLPPPIPMVRSISHGSSKTASLMSGPPPASPLDRRSKSSRPRKRSSSTRADQPPIPGGLRSPFTPGLSHAGFGEEVKPLEVSANRWVPSSLGSVGRMGSTALSGASSVPEVQTPEIVERKVKALLNKLSMEKFDSISDQIVAWANKSEAETDGQTLTLVIKLVFEKATDEATWSSMYALLCKKMLEEISPGVTDENIRDKTGKLIVGGQLFRQYLLSRCQADFERGWSARETLEEQQTAVAAASGVAPGEEVFSDEYYALQKVKRRGLGLVKFIGELFKLQMLTERIMHRCILKLLDEPAEEDIESVCQLLKTVGLALSGPKGKESMEMYFGRMKELSQDPNVSQRIRFMLMDVIDLRARNWVSKTQIAAPSTLAQVHETVTRETYESASGVKPIPIARGSSRRGQNRSERGSQRDPEASLLSNSTRSLNKAAGNSLTSTVGSPDDGMEVDTNRLRSPILARSPPSTSTTFHSLARLASEPGTSRMSRNISEPGKSRSRRGGERASTMASNAGVNEPRPMNRRPSADLVHLDAAISAGSIGRKRLQLLPRSVGNPDGGPSDLAPEYAARMREGNTADGPADVVAAPSLAVTIEEPPLMSEQQAKAKVEEDVKEFMQIRDFNEAVGYFESLPSHLRHLLVDRFVSRMMDSKEADIQLVLDLFAHVASLGVCSPEMFERGFGPTVEALDDIALDVPAAYTVVARLFRASRVSRDAVERLADSINVYGDVVGVHPRAKLLHEFDVTASTVEA